MAEDTLIDAEERKHFGLVQRWGSDWAEVIRAGNNGTENTCDPEIAGQAIAGAIYQCGAESDHMGVPREVVVENLTRLLVRALTP